LTGHDRIVLEEVVVVLDADSEVPARSLPWSEAEARRRAARWRIVMTLRPVATSIERESCRTTTPRITARRVWESTLSFVARIVPSRKRVPRTLMRAPTDARDACTVSPIPARPAATSVPR